MTANELKDILRNDFLRLRKKQSTENWYKRCFGVHVRRWEAFGKNTKLFQLLWWKTKI
jgi:hypothetical protein